MPQSFFNKSLNDLVSLINYMYIVIFNYVMPISDMFLIMYCMHVSFRIHQRQTIQSYCTGMCTNTRKTLQGGAKCIPPFLLMSVDIFARQGILTECSQLPDYVELSHERWVLHLFSFFLVKCSCSSFKLLLTLEMSAFQYLCTVVNLHYQLLW